MSSVSELAAEAMRFREMGNSEKILDALEGTFRLLSPTHFLVSTVPMPGRPVEPLVLRRHWSGRWPDDEVTSDDAVFREGVTLHRPVLHDDITETLLLRSALCRAAVADGARSIIWIPVNAFQPYQAIVMVGFAGTPDMDPLLLGGFECATVEAFRQLFVLKAVPRERPGDLSGRERRVVALSAVGKTASDIAEALAISQRTVHAHLQNASDKLRARNKTQTVVEALRYGQIAL
jgi:LuxR family quorum sensing-dependent transcriptional regulator